MSYYFDIFLIKEFHKNKLEHTFSGKTFFYGEISTITKIHSRYISYSVTLNNYKNLKLLSGHILNCISTNNYKNFKLIYINVSISWSIIIIIIQIHK